MKKIFVLIFTIFLLMSCAAGSNNLVGTPDAAGDLAGFFQGLWHGFIAFFAFIVSLFNKNVNIYEVHNNGVFYNLGFIIGASAFFGGSGGASSKKRRR